MATFEEILAQSYGNLVKAGEALTSPERIKQLHAFIHANEKPRPEALKVFKRFHNPFL